jgi:uncharacterized membrane protein YdjX (TVP38/TMEM64 family)
VGAVGPKLLEPLGGVPDGGAAAHVLSAVRTHGLWVLAAMALLPPTPRTAVLACAVAGLPPIEIGLAVALGRTLPVFVLAATGAAAPKILRRLRMVDRVMREVDAGRAGTP